MNCQEINNLLTEKDNEIKSKREKSIEYFELIKEDILDFIIKKHIDSNFEYDSYTIYDSDFIEILLKNTSPNLSKYNFEFWGMCTTRMTMIRRFPYTFSLTSREGFEKQEQRENQENDFLNGFDSNYLVNLIVNFLKKNGFKQKSGINRFTDERVYLFSFKITRQNLQSRCCGSNDSESEKENQNLGIVFFGIMIFCLLAFLLMINL